MLTILDPIVASPPVEQELASRLTTLDGAVIGLYNNTKLNAAEVLEVAAGIIQQQFAVKEFVRIVYPIGGAMNEALYPKPLDAALVTIGD